MLEFVSIMTKIYKFTGNRRENMSDVGLLCYCIPSVVIQEAVSTGDPELVQLCLQYRDYQRFTQRTEGVPGLLNKLREVL